jgi:hypothetical protein
MQIIAGSKSHVHTTILYIILYGIINVCVCVCVRSRVIYRGNIAFLVVVVENRCNCRRNFKCPLYSRQSAYINIVYMRIIHLYTCNIGIVYAATAKQKKKSDVMSVATTVAVGVTSAAART